MLSSVTFKCQVTMIVMNSGSQLSEMSTISHKLTSHVTSMSWSLYLSLSMVFCQFLSPYHSDQISPRSQDHTSLTLLFFWCFLKWICLCRCLCLVFVFFIVFFLVRSCLLITLIKCLKGHKSLGSLCSVLKTLIVSGAQGTDQGTDKVTYWAVLDS